MTPLEEEFIAVAKEILTEFGFSATLRRTSQSSYNAATLEATEGTASAPCLCAFFDPSNSKLTGYEQSLQNDHVKGKWFYLQCDTPVAVGDTVEYGTRKFKLFYKTEIGTTGTVIFNKVAADEVA